MKKIFFILFVSINLLSYSQIGFSFKISKPYYIFNFLETANSCNSCSTTFEDYINKELKNDIDFEKLTTDFSKINFNYSYTIPNLPSSRKNSRYIRDLIISNLINSSTLIEFRDKSIGILPNYDLQSLLLILEKTEKYYDKYIWEKCQLKAKEITEEANKHKNIIDEISPKIAHFYNTAMFNDIPYSVAFYPIPAQKGNSTATPHTNSLSVGFLTEKKENIANVLGVAIHEMCHVLYNEQNAHFQNELDTYFKESKSEYSSLANNFFDEALATAIGNGWAYKELTFGKIDTSEWYANDYINGFAHEIYPLVEEYLNTGKQLDKTFINRAIELFSKKFPKSITDYNTLMNNVIIYTDEEDNQNANKILNLIKSKFKMSHYGFSSPILHEYSLEDLKNSSATQFIVINKNVKQNMEKLSEIFIPLKEINLQENTVYTFKDNDRVITIIKYDTFANLDILLNKIKEKQYFDTNSIIQTKI